ncbi:Scarecrow-like protein [Melia azedarach]|uniref:Scarecrow-like protein n=1 Tax=Melia azedarach TaxID=155640 RepID=A0ACC1YQP9_MELAZ|nr:Scarecrow-like protein [Melia azedarach]
MNHLQFDHGSASVCSNQNHADKFKLNDNSIDSPPSPTPPSPETNPQAPSASTSSSSVSSYGDPADISELSHATLRYISDMLMEEDLEGKTCMLQDCLALQAAEKSFYEVLGQKYPPSPNQASSSLNQNSNRQNDFCTTSSYSDGRNGSSASCLAEPNWISNQGNYKLPVVQTFPENSIIVQSLYNGIQPFGLSGEVREASNFPQIDDIVIINSKSVASTVKERGYSSPYGSRGRKSYELEDSNYLEEGRSNKHSAISVAVYEPSEMIDEVVLCKCENNKTATCLIHGFFPNGSSGKVQQNGQSKGSNGGTKRSKRKGKKKEVVDLWTLLNVCAQAVANYDQRTANEILQQIRQHSSPFGDGNQRLAHYFANGLEARLAGTRTPIRTHLGGRASAAEIIQGYKWPCLIQRISKRPTGTPKIRITGIEFPQPGFRPAERVEETGHRLKCYSQRFSVPFDYNAIAEKWQNIQLEDLKIDKEEITVVNCMYRMRNLPDDTVVINSPRDAVLELIRKINPDIFILGVVNGTHNAPFFLPRFREALFHFSTCFDMFDSTVPREDQGRMVFEREIYGKDAMNVIACEGIERVERPETYKQWQARNLRAGFRQLQLGKDILKSVMTLVKSNFHPDFVIDEVGQWMLQGWKGRLAYALSVWKPIQDS